MVAGRGYVMRLALSLAVLSTVEVPSSQTGFTQFDDIRFAGFFKIYKI